MSQRIYERSNLMINTQSPNEPTPKCDLEPEQNVILSPARFIYDMSLSPRPLNDISVAGRAVTFFFCVCAWALVIIIISNERNPKFSHHHVNPPIHKYAPYIDKAHDSDCDSYSKHCLKSNDK